MSSSLAKLLFAIPDEFSKNNGEASCCLLQYRAFCLCKSGGLEVDWFDHEEIEEFGQISPGTDQNTDRRVFVLFEFYGVCFNYLKEIGVKIVSPIVIIQCYAWNSPLPMRVNPTWSNTLYGHVITINGFTMDEQDEIRAMVLRLGGGIRTCLTYETTVLMVKVYNEEEEIISKAIDADVNIVLPEWLKNLWDKATSIENDQNDFLCEDLFTQYDPQVQNPEVLEQRQDVERWISTVSANYSVTNTNNSIRNRSQEEVSDGVIPEDEEDNNEGNGEITERRETTDKEETMEVEENPEITDDASKEPEITGDGEGEREITVIGDSQRESTGNEENLDITHDEIRSLRIVESQGLREETENISNDDRPPENTAEFTEQTERRITRSQSQLTQNQELSQEQSEAYKAYIQRGCTFSDDENDSSPIYNTRGLTAIESSAGTIESITIMGPPKLRPKRKATGPAINGEVRRKHNIVVNDKSISFGSTQGTQGTQLAPDGHSQLVRDIAQFDKDSEQWANARAGALKKIVSPDRERKKAADEAAGGMRRNLRPRRK